MRQICEVADQPLVWISAGLWRGCELRSGGETLAVLQTRLIGLETIDSAEGRWTFGWRGLIRKTLTVSADETDIAVFRPRFTGRGTLECSTGSRYVWTPSSFWSAEWWFAREGGEPLICFSAFRKLTVFTATREMMVLIAPAARALHELQLLTLLGCYLKTDQSIRRVTAP